MKALPQGVIDVPLDEWSEKTPDSCPELKGLSFDGHVAAREQARLLEKGRALVVAERHDGIAVESSSWVGSVTLGTIRIAVSPKLGGTRLIGLLRYVYGLRNLRLLPEHAGVTGGTSFVDLLIFQLAMEIEDILRQGLHREYRTREANLSSPRGRILFSRLAAGGSIGTAALPCRYHERSENHLANQVLLSGLRLASRLTEDVHLRSTLRLLARSLSVEVSEAPLDLPMFEELDRRSNRLIAHYRPAIELIRLLHDGAGASTKGTDRRPLKGFLFDMNAFFQRLVFKFLREYLDGFEVEGEHRLKGVFHYQPMPGAPDKKDPVPRPDFAVLVKRKPIIFLDAKYRDLAKHALPRDMLYQLAIYALGRSDCPQSAILYPTVSQLAKPACIEVLDATEGKPRAKVFLRPINLDLLLSVVAAPGVPGAAQNGRQLARQLAGLP